MQTIHYANHAGHRSPPPGSMPIPFCTDYLPQSVCMPDAPFSVMLAEMHAPRIRHTPTRNVRRPNDIRRELPDIPAEISARSAGCAERREDRFGAVMRGEGPMSCLEIGYETRISRDAARSAMQYLLRTRHVACRKADSGEVRYEWVEK